MTTVSDTAKKLFSSGLAALDIGDFAKAETFFTKTLEFVPNSIPTLSNLLFCKFQQKKFHETVELAKRILEVNRDILDVYHILVASYKELSQYELALQACETILSFNPRDSEALNNKGVILNNLGRHDEAIATLTEALAINPRAAQTLVNRGNARRAQTEFAAALSDYDKALSIRPDLGSAWLGRANTCADLKRYDEAVAAYDKALAIKSDHAEAVLGRGNVLADLKRYDEAVAAFDQALAIKPDLTAAMLGRGNVLADLKRYDEAVAAFDQALAIKPDLTAAWLGRGNVLADLKRYNEALAAYEKVLSISPADAKAWLGLCNVFTDLKRYDEAIAASDKAIAIKPTDADAWLGRGYIFSSLNRDVEALQCFDTALDLNKNFAEAYLNKALLMLSRGEYEEGWKFYEWRWRIKNYTTPNRNFTQPLWLNDSDISGKRLLVHSEQGLGDTIQFSRYLSHLADKNCKIIFEAQQPLVSLFKAQGWNCDVTAHGDKLPPFDLHCPLMSLPFAFKTTIDTIPNKSPYIRTAGTGKFDTLELDHSSIKPRIGVAWSGNAKFARGNDVSRPIPLSTLRTIMVEEYEWYRLQKDLRDSDRDALAELSTMIDYSKSFESFADTAALIERLDLVISIDTSIAHLAGAMGKPVWILLPFHPDFRWLRERNDSPWYPSARLYRQTTDGDWSDVLAQVSHDLNQFLKAV